MGKIVAIGGGHITTGKVNQIEPTLKRDEKIDTEIIKLSGKKNPRVLFIPTASSDSSIYIKHVQSHFSFLTKEPIDVLLTVKQKPTQKEIEQKILDSDIIYVGGGNTLKMMNIWRTLGIDTVLRQAFSMGKVLSGISAGSICWFKYGNSDSRKFKNLTADYIRVSGLHLVKAMHCPHYDSEGDRKESLKKMMLRTPGVAIALEDHVALIIIDNAYKIVSAKKNAYAYKVYWKNGLFYEDRLKSQDMFSPIEPLLIA